MTTGLSLYNTLTRRKEAFNPRENGKTVKMFTCGPSVYAWPHIGNYRTFLFEDVLQRYLEYKGYTVRRVINFTDVEDKAIQKAAMDGIDPAKVTKPAEQRFLSDCRLLDIALPDLIPRSSTCVDQAVFLIEKLMEKGHAYRHGPDIFFDPLTFKGFGKLFRLDISRWPKQKVRFRKDTYPGKRWNRGDFILWKGRRTEDGNLYWRTPLGDGRPAWNIQDPAIVTRHLGYTIDIWCGGVDNLYRHHDYNIAVVEAVSGQKLSAYWLHCEHVLSGKKKMSKSLGNIVHVKDLLDMGFKPRHIRFFLIYGHYRQQIDLNIESLYLARGKIDTFRELVGRLKNNRRLSKGADREASNIVSNMTAAFQERMDDNLDVKGAFDQVFQSLLAIEKQMAERGLSSADHSRAMTALKQMDGVFKIMGLT